MKNNNFYVKFVIITKKIININIITTLNFTVINAKPIVVCNVLK